MDIEKFIDIYFTYLTSYIIDAGGEPSMIDYDEVEMWILNDEYLYNFAIERGVEI